VVDHSIRDLRFCFARRTLGLAVQGAFQVERVDVVTRITASDTSRLVVTVISPSGTEVYLRVGGDEGTVIDTAWGAEEEPIEPLEALEGEAGQGRWTVTLYDPRCPYPVTVEELGLVFRPRAAKGPYLRVEGWAASLEAGRPGVRIAGGGLDQSSIALEVVQWDAGEDGVAQGGGNDDVRLGPVAARWETTLAAEAGTIDPDTGVLVAGEETGSGELRWQTDGEGGSLPVAVYPPDWVP
jgi:hypothetical protein